MARARKPESFVWRDNEVKLLLTLDDEVSRFQENAAARTRACSRHCCCCYEASRGSEVEGWRSRGGAMMSSTHRAGRRFQILPP